MRASFSPEQRKAMRLAAWLTVPYGALTLFPGVLLALGSFNRWQPGSGFNRSQLVELAIAGGLLAAGFGLLIEAMFVSNGNVRAAFVCIAILAAHALLIIAFILIAFVIEGPDAVSATIAGIHAILAGLAIWLNLRMVKRCRPAQPPTNQGAAVV